MHCNTKNMFMFFIHAVCFLLIGNLFFSIGCAGTRPDVLTGGENAGETKTVLSIDITEKETTSMVLIKANQPMAYTSVKQLLPMAVIIYLPNTSMGNFQVPETTENDIIDSISVSESPSEIEKEMVSRIEIALKRDVPYDIETENNALLVSFQNEIDSSDTVAEFNDPDIIAFSTEMEAKSGTETVILSDEVQTVSLEQNDILITDDKPVIDQDIHDVPEKGEILIPDQIAMSSIDVLSSGDDILVSVLANGSIHQYKTLTLKKTDQLPARIVVDMFGLKSPFDVEKIIPVNLQSAERIRHLGYPDKVRLVIDTYDEYLSNFTVQPVEKGLEIKVRTSSIQNEAQMTAGSAPMMEEGRLTEDTEATQEVIIVPVASAQLPAGENRVYSEKVLIPPASDQSQDLKGFEKNQETDSSSSASAVLNRIEFSGLAAGKSALILGATRKIHYDVKEVAENKLVLRLFNTRLPEHRKRPLITTRFESAVNRVLPIQNDSMKDSIISIELRQMVPYEVEQTDNIVKILFEASSIPPKPLETAGLPSWRQVMADTLASEETSSMDIPVVEAKVDDKKDLLDQVDDEMAEDEIARLTPPGKKYTGEKIALDFFETDIKNVFRILREVSGKNFAIDKDVTGTVTLTLERPVPWDQVLDLILKMNQLGKIEEHDVIRIARMTTITQEEETRKAQIAAKAQARKQEIEVEPLITEYISVNYSDARSEILPHLNNIATKERGTLSVDVRTNMIIMTDTAERIRQAREIVQRLDMVTPQVIIEARIVEASSSFSKEIGVVWTTDGGIGNEDPNAGTGPQRGYDVLGGTWGYDTAVNLPPAASAGAIGFQFTRIFGTPLVIDAKLGAMESLGEGKIVSAPKVMTLNNKKAVIKQGREVPYSVVSQDGVNTEFKDVDLLLEVTPHVTPDDRVSLRVRITKDEIAEFSVDGVPSLSTKQAETELLINDGETIVIGGILQTTEQKTTRKVPGLGNLPVLSWLFKSTIDNSRKEELLIFLTPRIMRLEQKTI